MEVYAPNSRAANNYIKNRLQGYIYRLFMKKSVSHRLRISDIMNLFPGNSETSIRKRLKDCADFQRGGDDSGWWTVKGKRDRPVTLYRDLSSLLPLPRIILPRPPACLTELR